MIIYLVKYLHTFSWVSLFFLLVLACKNEPTNSEPSPPTLLFPPNNLNLALAEDNSYISWSIPNDGKYYSFSYEITTDPAFQIDVIKGGAYHKCDAASCAANKYVPLETFKQYFWHVKFSGGQISDWSKVWKFNTTTGFWDHTNLDNLMVFGIAAGQNNECFAATNKGLYCSTNGGREWSPTSLSAWSTSVYVNSDGILFVGSNAKIYRSLNSGLTWTTYDLANTNSASYVKTFTVNSAGEILAGADNWVNSGGGIFLSSDKGDSWNKISLNDTSVYALAINSSGDIFAGIGTSSSYNIGTIMKSSNNGRSWLKKDQGLKGSEILSLAINAHGHIFAGSNRDWIFKSTDNGELWTQLSTSSTDEIVKSMVINSQNHIYVTKKGYGVFGSFNNGNSWFSANAGLPKYENSALSLCLSTYLLVGTDKKGIYISENPLD